MSSGLGFYSWLLMCSLGILAGEGFQDWALELFLTEVIPCCE